MAELSNNEAGRGFTHIYTATYEDLQTIGNGMKLKHLLAQLPSSLMWELAQVTLMSSSMLLM